jgi:hypothetical protein
MALVIFHLQDEAGKPLGGVVAQSVGGPGPWESVTNACGDVMDPVTQAAGVTLEPGHYDVTFSKAGYETLTLPADLAECGIITQALTKATLPGRPPESVRPPNTGELPPVPTRAEVCALQTSLAGLTYPTLQYGAIPAWFYGALGTADRQLAREAHRDAGDTHIPMPITEAYREGGTLWPAGLANGYDYTDTEGLETFRALAHEAIADGFFLDVALGGDGLGEGPGYNDPVGRTYGCQWLMNGNLERIIRALQGDGSKDRPDLTPYIIFRPGWDAVFYSWAGSAQRAHVPLRWWRQRVPQPVQLSTKELDDQQTRVKQFGELFRQILPAGYLSIEHTPGTIPCGEGGGDYAPGGLMTTYDTILSEFNTVHEDAYWQIVGRMLEHYVRPPDQPAGDDPHPPWYLRTPSPRGPYFYVAFEPTQAGVYEWCRGRCTIEQIKQQDAYMRSTGVTLTGYPVRW